eukprot:SAG11_NODE_15037_length_591_cov_0.802846_2_plen_34_part_01
MQQAEAQAASKETVLLKLRVELEQTTRRRNPPAA